MLYSELEELQKCCLFVSMKCNNLKQKKREKISNSLVKISVRQKYKFQNYKLKYPENEISLLYYSL